MPALTKEQIDAWSKRNKGAFEGLLNVNQFVPVSGDIQSGIMATNDLSQGNYGSAALNAVGLLPFVPALGGVLKSVPAKESLRAVADANFNYGIPIGNKVMDISSLKGIMSSSVDDQKKVNDLVAKIKSPDGFIERLIVDDAGNVLEGQHRLNALRKLGENQVPVSVIKNMDNAINDLTASGIRAENARQIVQNAYEMKSEAGSIGKAKKMFDIPSSYSSAYDIVFNYLK
jgi:hypothetical protein